jgi:YVTN family beta-propeller protein
MLLLALLIVPAQSEEMFPVTAIIGGGQSGALLDTIKAAGFNTTWMLGCSSSEELLNNISVYKIKGLKAVVHYAVHPSNTKYNPHRFASGIHHRHQVESDSVFNKGSQYGYVDGSYWSSENRGFMVYWDREKAYDWNRRWWLYRNNTENRSPANYGSAPWYFDRADYKAVFRIKYTGTGANDSVCYIKTAKRVDVWPNPDSLYQQDSVVLKTNDFIAPNTFKLCTLSYYWLNGESRWIDYQVYNYGNYKISVDYIDVYDCIYDSLANNILDTLTGKRYSDYMGEIAETYSDTSVVYRFYMFDEPVKSQLESYYLTDQRLRSAGNVPGITTTVAQYPCSFGKIGSSDWADTTYYSQFVQTTNPAQLLINVLPLFGYSGLSLDGFETSDSCYRTPVDSGCYLQKQFDVMAKYCRAGMKACKLTLPETPMQVLVQCFGDSLLDSNQVPIAEGRWRMPTPREFKCMSYMALAHGAKGLHLSNFTVGIIDYFVWSGVHQYWRQTAMADENGRILHPDMFAAAKEINNRANFWASTLLNLTCDQAFREQGGSLPAGNFITEVSDSLVQVGLFHHKTNTNDKYFMLVNRHCLPTDTLTVTINISNTEPFFITDMLTGNPASGQLTAGTNVPFSYKLQPGEGRLFRIVPFTAQIKISQNATYTNFRFVQVDDPASSSLHTVDSVQITQKYYVKTPEDTAARPDYIDYYWAADTSPWLPYSASTIKYLENSIDNKANIFELQFKIGGGKILTPKYSAQIFFNDVSPVNGAITINNNANFTNSQTVNVKLAGTDVFPGLSQMRYAEAPFGNPSGYVNMVKNGTFEDTTNWVLDNAEFYDGFLHLKGYHTGPGPTQIGSSAKQIIPGSGLNAFKGKLVRLCDDIYAHDVISSYKIVDLFYADTLQPNSVRLLEKPIASTPEVVWKSSSDTVTLKVDTARPLDRIEISYNIYGIDVPPPPPDDDPLFNTIVVDNIRLEPVELKSGAQPDIIPPASYYIYDGWDYADTNYSYSYMLSSGDGAKRVYMQLGDLAGNISAEPGWYDEIVLDMTAPWTTIHSPQNGANVSVDTFSVWCTVTDNFVIKSWTLELKQHNLTAWQTVKEGLYGIKKRPIHINCDSLGMLGGRYYDFRLTATDSAGNSGQTTITIYYCHEVEPALSIDPEFATFNSLPVDATCDNIGNIYVTDTQADKIWKFSPEGDSLLCFGYKYTGQDTLGLNHPKGIAVDDSGNIWITDCYQSKVKKYDGQGNYISTIGKHGNKAGEFNQPTGIAISGNEIYVVDHLNDRVQVFNKTGAFIRQFGNNCLKQPAGIAIRNNETEKLVYVCDSKNNQIAIFDTAGNLVNTIVSLGLDKPWDICFDNNNNLYIADVYNNRVIELDPWHNKLLTFGIQGQEAGQFKLPQGLAVSPDGKYLYVADTHNDRLQRFKMFFDMGTLGGPQTSGKRQITNTAPTVFGLSQCYPNPCKQKTSINYQIPKAGNVGLKVYNTLGQVVKTLVNENQQPGYYTINWDGRDESNRQAATGVYFYRLASGEYKNTKKIVLLR